MHDAKFKEPTVTEQVMIVTLREVIEGVMYHNENVRLSDALNAEAKQHSRYVSLKDAVVYSIATGREILRTAFLVVSHSHIIYMTPKAAVRVAVHPGLEAENGKDDRDAGVGTDDLLPDTPEVHWHSVAPAGATMSHGAGSPGGLDGTAVAVAAATVDATRTMDATAKVGPAPPPAAHAPADQHIVSRQAMLKTLAAIRAHAEDHKVVMGAAGRDLD